MKGHVVWLVLRGCPRCYSFTTTTNITLYFLINKLNLSIMCVKTYLLKKTFIIENP
jgi:hypothetical protein